MTIPLPLAVALGASAALTALVAPNGALHAQPTIPNRIAVLQGLDKVTARIQMLEAPLDEEIRFGSLAIRARACYETPPTEPPESAAFLEIEELGPTPDAGEPRETAFTGWMFASTPGISALEHPVFDVWVIDCREPETTAPQPLRIEPLPPATAQ